MLCSKVVRNVRQVLGKRRVTWRAQDVCVKNDPSLFEKERPEKVFKTEVCPKRTLHKEQKIRNGDLCGFY
jgi:hypothetical protein